MRACSTVQQLLCHGGYCELILSLPRTSCRLLFTARPTDRPLAGNPLRDVVRSRNPSKSTLAHDAIATAVLHKHHPIIRVGAGLIQFVYRSRLRLATEATRDRNAFSPFFPQVLQAIVSCLPFDGRLILDLPERDVGQSPLCAALTHAARILTRNAQKWHIPESVEEQISATAQALDQSIAHRIQKAEAAVHNGVQQDSGFALHTNAMCSFMEQTVTENHNMHTRVNALTLMFENFIKKSEGGGAGQKRGRGKT